MDELPVAPPEDPTSRPASGGPVAVAADGTPIAGLLPDAPRVGDPPPEEPAPDVLPDAPPKYPPGTISVRVLATLAVLALSYVASELVVTVMLAMFLALIANPVVTRLRKMFIPR